ncbi:MAG TPA: hypothetical protein DEA08_36900 [Planctomycetes bacterium]|nr:hypothetical protein [Planctomycetota bacterium]
MKQAAWTTLLIALAAPAWGSDSPEGELSAGAALAARIESAADADARAALLKDVATLSPKQQARFVRHARRLREEGGGWRHLAPALAALGTKAAAHELILPLTIPRERDDGYAEDALEHLARFSPRHVMPGLVRGLARRERSVWRRVRPVLEGLLLQARAPRTFRYFVYAIEDFQERLERDHGAREQRLVAERLSALATRVTLALGAKDLRRFLRMLRIERAPESLAFGLALGLRKRIQTESDERIAALRERLELGPDEALAPEELAGIQAALPHQDTLYRLAQRDEARVRAEAFRAAALELSSLDPEWFQTLHRSLASARPRVERDAAWSTLKSASGVSLRQNQPTWQQWWDRIQQGAAE